MKKMWGGGSAHQMNIGWNFPFRLLSGWNSLSKRIALLCHLLGLIIHGFDVTKEKKHKMLEVIDRNFACFGMKRVGLNNTCVS